MELTNSKKYHLKLDDCIFYLGVFFIPFDNLFFAPSEGWATVAPIIFFFYVLCNLNFVKLNKKVLKFVLLLIGLSLFNYIFYPPVLSAFADTAISLVLGISFFLSIYIHFFVKKKKATLFLKVLFIAYLISYFYGILSLFNISFIDNIMSFLEKRSYDRLQFTFTEPSFISMHLYGVILPVIILFKEYKEKKYLIILLIIYGVTALLFCESSRFIIDTVIITVVLYIYWLIKFKCKLQYKLLSILLLILFGLIIIIVFWHDDRIGNILSNGIYADASLAARWFRINAIIKGILQNPLSILLGFGFSNTHYPFNIGYDAAYIEYSNQYLYEIESIRNTVDPSFFCGHIRVIADFGVLVYLYLFYMLYKQKNKNILVCVIVMYLYLQFDSYAFYTIWLYILNLLFINDNNRIKI